MKVILLQDVPKVGRKNEVKDVSDGFARNFLFAKNLAKPATIESLKTIENEKARQDKAKTEEYQKYKTVVDKLKSLNLKFKVKMVGKGKAFGSVTPLKIKEALEKQGVPVEKESILLEKSIKTTGEHLIKIRFPRDLVGEVKITIEAQ